MKARTEDGSMRSLQYHPRITRGENKRLTITINTNNYEQTNNFYNSLKTK